MMHVREIGLAALVAGGLGLAAPAHAAPFAPGAVPLADEAAAVTVAYGCGRGYAPVYGVCQPIYRRYGYYGPGRAYGYYGPRYGVGLPGLRIGPYGAGVSFY